MSKTTRIAKELPLLTDNFSARLGWAISSNHIKPSATVLEREFNLRWKGAPITANATRKWLLGLSVPTMDKLDVLAKWLEVSPQWLQWGAKSDIHDGEDESSLIQDYRSLEPLDKKMLRSLLEVMLRERRLIADAKRSKLSEKMVSI